MVGEVIINSLHVHALYGLEQLRMNEPHLRNDKRSTPSTEPTKLFNLPCKRLPDRTLWVRPFCKARRCRKLPKFHVISNYFTGGAGGVGPGSQTQEHTSSLVIRECCAQRPHIGSHSFHSSFQRAEQWPPRWATTRKCGASPGINTSPGRPLSPQSTARGDVEKPSPSVRFSAGPSVSERGSVWIRHHLPCLPLGSRQLGVPG